MILLFRHKWKLKVICLLGRDFCGYVGNHYFPKPLSTEEEKEMLLRRENGDAEARNILIERNLRLVAHICKKYENTNVDKDDLISIGTIGLIKAIDSFSMDRKVRLATYAARCVENEILMFLRAGKNLRQDVSLYEPLGHDKEGNEIALIDILSTGENTMIEDLELKHLKSELLKHMDTLEPRERRVLIMRYGLKDDHKQTQRKVAEQLGISRSYVSRIESKALKKLFGVLKET
ncbi:MAG TPA: RNA polymerase sporulation sigma factor SigK [Firmicutes bacterium]|nr:RNA polymerase sporulation sigma factor SigK [Bacillota bacterium]